MCVSDIARSLSTIFLPLFLLANLPVCLSNGYPCIETNDGDNELISTCCSNTHCQRSNMTQSTCGGGGLSPSKNSIDFF
jgi:hypothetical protein